ncbi:TPA: K(+)-transporting ATPase subunit F [Klebsiella pneumoniae]|nr:K(+)-transporting ATPase subunit F [Klebsiella pneumoniae]
MDCDCRRTHGVGLVFLLLAYLVYALIHAEAF